MNFISTKKPRWLMRALNPRSPMTENNETVKLISYDNRVAPTIIRIGTRGKGKFVKLTNEEAIKRANKNNTFLEFATNKQAEKFAKNFSNIIPNTFKNKPRRISK
tara:strand:+ start:752 stop:1066 length:315 start_codon:yes stop_codon:yes gene_type:complete